MKHLIPSLLCLILLLTLALPVFAEESTPQPDPPTETEVPKETQAPVQTAPSPETQPTEHTHNWVKVVVPSTCTAEGGTAVVCSICEAIDSVELSPKAEHAYDNSCDPDCNVCGHSREAAHSFGTGWDYNSRKHWHVCSVCGSKGEALDHFPGPAATEERDQFCLTCGLLMTKKLAHTHKFRDAWQSDETGHWYPCQNCQERKNFAGHTYSDPCDPDCDACGYTRATAHSFAEAFHCDESGHWQVCSLCADAAAPEPHIPAEFSPPEGPLLCSACGYELEAAPVHTHSFSETWQYNEDSHWQTCACGEASESLPHTWQETDGSRQCSVCQTRQLQESPASAFPWGIVLAVLAALLVLCAGALIFLLRRPG